MQAYALQKAIEKLDCRAEQISYGGYAEQKIFEVKCTDSSGSGIPVGKERMEKTDSYR